MHTHAIYLTNEEVERFQKQKQALAQAFTRFHAARSALEDEIAEANLDGETSCAARHFQDLVDKIEKA